ncbi:NAD(+) diphosphatase [Lysobacter solisilvae (ex Woo and Kim 2022)]|uniref:NAD(+) diphosphatase n=1 Tax=Agrilutibacter terrestris TaxID=2865112 RepID=A0A7H0FZX6_9GAMM|nr:NAD(+) diphosphatase [Lysobacter terrestris]QNP41592.1 NAD(+) diphosphatase [Lysobacter terrestris]
MPASPFAFVETDAVRAALDRADHLRTDPDALMRLWPQARVVLLDEDGLAHADEQRRLLAPTGEQLSEGPGGSGAAVFLGLDAEGRGWFALDAALTAFTAPQRTDLRSAAMHWPAFDAAVFAQARAVQHWRQRHRHCGVCGGTLVYSRGGWLGTCTQCQAEHYPRTDPAVIVAVSDGERLLLGRQGSWPARRYSTIAGFVEPGESLEHTVAREVLEETGVRVKSCRYLGSQPWPFPGSLMLGFVADAHPDVPRISDELEDARWFSRDEVRAAQAREADPAGDDGSGLLVSPRLSIARWLIDQWVDGLR